MTTTQYISALPTSTTVALTDIIPATQGSTGSGTGTTRGLTLRQVRGGFVASVLDYGADATGATDSTTAIQAAINSGAVAVYVPPGAFKFSTLTIPDTKYFNLFGCGNASILVQTGAGIVWPTQTGDNYYSEGYIRDLAFDGTAGTSHTINTTYVGGLTLQNLYFNNVPVGYSSIYVNGFTGHSTHDIRLSNIQVYSSTAGHSGIRFGALASDSSVDGYILNGNFAVSYGLYFDSGAASIKVSNSHPYNTNVNTVYGGATNEIQFLNCTLDNSTNDLVSFSGASNTMFTGCFFEATKSGYSDVTLANCSVTKLVSCIFDGANGAAACVTETGTSNNTTVLGGDITSPGNYTNLFVFVGAQSAARFVNNYLPLGIPFNFSGVGASAQSQNTTLYYGVNGSQSTAGATDYLIPYNAVLQQVVIGTDNTPAAGQTFSFTVYVQGSSVGTGTVSHGNYGCTITINQSVAATNVLHIGSVFSATSGSATVRYSVQFLA